MSADPQNPADPSDTPPAESPATELAEPETGFASSLTSEILAAPAQALEPLPDFKPFDPGIRRPRIGLALGSGVARGWAHIGVVRELHKMGIPVDMIAGTSIGAVVGGALATDSLDELENWARDLRETTFFRLMEMKFGMGGGLFGSSRFDSLMRENFGDKDFSQVNIPLVTVACELKTGHEIWLKTGDLAQAVQASFAIPGVFEPQQIGGRWLVDGAVVNPVPANVCRAAGCDLVIAVNLAEDLYGQVRAEKEGGTGTGEYGVFREIQQSASAGGRRGQMNFVRNLLRRKNQGPSLFANVVASLNILQNRIARSRLAGDPPDVSINPRVGHVGLMEFHRAGELIEVGSQAFEEAKPRLEDALAVITHRMNCQF